MDKVAGNVVDDVVENTVGQGGGHRLSGPEVFRIGRFVFSILHCAVSSSPCSQCDFESTHVGNIKNHKESPATWSAL